MATPFTAHVVWCTIWVVDGSGLLASASAQGGVVTRQQALEAGLSGSAIDRRLRSGRWVQLREGVYRLFPSRDDLDLLTAAIVALPGSVVSHASAGVLHGLRVVADEPTVTVHASQAHDFREVAVRRTRTLRPGHCTEVGGLAVTTVARTLVDLASDLRPAVWRSLAEGTLVSRRCTVQQVAAVAEVACGRGKSGSRVVGELLADPLAGASKLEQKARQAIATWGLPEPEVEFPVPWSPSKSFDLAYPAVALAIELDGRAHHSGPHQFNADRARDREAAKHGWLVIRFTWDDLTQRPHEFVRTLSELISKRSVG